jgi:formylglycine-generating enzyme required for sulfatase activity
VRPPEDPRVRLEPALRLARAAGLGALVVAVGLAAACDNRKAYIRRPDGAVMDPRPCEDEAPVTKPALEARRRACRELCEERSRAHCEVLSRICLTQVDGKLLCPQESVKALVDACEMGSAGSCQAAGQAIQRGDHGVKPDAAKAAPLLARACQLEPTLCFRVEPKASQAALDALAPVAVAGGAFKPAPRTPASTQPAPARVTVAPFDVDRTEVTVAAYAACVAAGKCSEPQGGGDCNWGRADHLDHPMNCVSAGEAAAFCAWRGRRLPDEDEWAFAAHGVDGRPFPWGKAPPAGQLCWRSPGTCPAAGHPAGKSPEGALGLEGNVAEWTTGQEPIVEPPKSKREKPPAPTMAAVAWGGSYADTDATKLGAASRRAHKFYETLPTVGFRCVSPRRGR